MATNGDLKRWYGQTPQVANDFARLDEDGNLIKGVLYKHVIKFTVSTNTYHLAFICPTSTKFTSAAEIDFTKGFLACGEAQAESATDGIVTGAIKTTAGSYKLIAQFVTSGIVTASVVEFAGTIIDADPIRIN